jgi:hypothetical protein
MFEGSRIVYQGRGTTELPLRLLKEPNYICFGTDVGPNRNGLASGLPDATRDLTGKIGVTQEVDGNCVSSFSRE